MGAAGVAKHHDALRRGAADNGFAQLQIEHAHLVAQPVAQQLPPRAHLVADAALGLQVGIQAAVGGPDFLHRGRRKAGAHAGVGGQGRGKFFQQSHSGRQYRPEIAGKPVARGVGSGRAAARDAVAQAVVAGGGRQQQAGRQLIISLREHEARGGRDVVVVAQPAGQPAHVQVAAAVGQATLKLAAAL